MKAIIFLLALGEMFAMGLALGFPNLAISNFAVAFALLVFVNLDLEIF